MDGQGLLNSMASSSSFFPFLSFILLMREFPLIFHSLVGLMVCLGWLQLTALD